MATLTKAHTAARASSGPTAGPLRVLILALTAATAAIHASLGGPLFLANAAGYALLALGMALPGPFAAWRWLTRLALLGFTAATIGAWFLFGGRFPLAYFDKALEVVLVGLLGAEIRLNDGGPAAVAGRLRDLAGSVGRRAARSAGR